MCRKCSDKIVTAIIASFKEVNIGNDSFHEESTFKYLDDLIGQCGGCSDVVSTRIVRECLQNVCNKCAFVW